MRRVIPVLVAALVALLIWVNADDQGASSGVPQGHSTPGSYDDSRSAGVPSPSDGADDKPVPGELDPQTGLFWVAESELPSEALDTLKAIDDDGPYRYDSDGVVFENREGLLPPHETGYYHEFTVVTPGSADRGARRIVTGAADEFFYTGDHYGSFLRIAR